jgi:hypothetical protein
LDASQWYFHIGANRSKVTEAQWGIGTIMAQWMSDAGRRPGHIGQIAILTRHCAMALL